MFIKALNIAKRENIKYIHISAHGFDEGFLLLTVILLRGVISTVLHGQFYEGSVFVSQVALLAME